jgi:hypothetical protein
MLNGMMIIDSNTNELHAADEALLPVRDETGCGPEVKLI